MQRKAFKKWFFITLLCAAHSFFWGVMTQASFLAMLLGVLTVAAAFAGVESHPCYQARRAAAPRFAKALDGGVKFRCWLAVYILLTSAFIMFSTRETSGLWGIIAAPYTGELFIGMGAISITHWLTGVNIEAASAQLVPFTAGHFFATYIATMLTALAHTLILGVFCVVAYGVVRVCGRGTPPSVPDDTTAA
jgi:hypothetical protein